ncbi:hypothetical protein CJP72_21860 [Citrobacter sp. NCU1]|uniref:hypothetical protein n=1 Tax=Citrobacter sp. NCU1 TaxID=2026683 RepID=UPI0013912E1B|nr:hypothetical protein [Citrobacter sp. NCU1]NDO83305.1 hypothetical protein [Citrobacter sp. NCU1]
MVNMLSIRNRIVAVLTKQSVAEFLDDQKMLNEVKNEKAKIISEVALNDPIIRARFNDLLNQH